MNSHRVQTLKHWGLWVVQDDGHFSYVEDQQIDLSRELSSDGEYPDKME